MKTLYSLYARELGRLRRGIKERPDENKRQKAIENLVKARAARAEKRRQAKAALPPAPEPPPEPERIYLKID